MKFEVGGKEVPIKPTRPIESPEAEELLFEDYLKSIASEASGSAEAGQTLIEYYRQADEGTKRAMKEAWKLRMGLTEIKPSQFKRST